MPSNKRRNHRNRARAGKKQAIEELCKVWKRYPSIDAAHNKDALKKITNRGYNKSDVEWVATEKVHGANFCILTDGTYIIAAKRNGLLIPSNTNDDDKNKNDNGNGNGNNNNNKNQNIDQFFKGWQNVVDNHRNNVLNTFKLIQNNIDENVKTLMIFGELFGGYYEMPNEQTLINNANNVNNDANNDATEIKTNDDGNANNTNNDSILEIYQEYKQLCANHDAIQVGLSYSPKHHFYPFDIKIIRETNDNKANIDNNDNNDEMKTVARAENENENENDSNNNGNNIIGSNSYYLTFKQSEILFEQAKFEIYAKSLMVGTMDEILTQFRKDDYINKMKTTIPQRLNLKIMPNINTLQSEGIVLRIYDKNDIFDLQYCRIKLKCKDFAEICMENDWICQSLNGNNNNNNENKNSDGSNNISKSGTRRRKRKSKKMLYTSEEIDEMSKNATLIEIVKNNPKLLHLIQACTNRNRCNATESKIGKLNQNNFKEITQFFINDIWDEIVELQPMLEKLNKKSKRIVKRYITAVVNTYMQSKKV